MRQLVQWLSRLLGGLSSKPSVAVVPSDKEKEIAQKAEEMFAAAEEKFAAAEKKFKEFEERLSRHEGAN